jgi:hypothetical protein
MARLVRTRREGTQVFTGLRTNTWPGWTATACTTPSRLVPKFRAITWTRRSRRWSPCLGRDRALIAHRRCGCLSRQYKRKRSAVCALRFKAPPRSPPQPHLLYGDVLDILLATNDQDSNRYRQATCAGSRLTDRAKTPTPSRAAAPWPGAVHCDSCKLKEHNRSGYRRPELNLQPCTEARKSFLAALNERVCTLGAN